MILGAATLTKRPVYSLNWSTKNVDRPVWPVPCRKFDPRCTILCLPIEEETCHGHGRSENPDV